ncbi:hypothetical protein [Clostridium sp. C2-6-12]|uniref:hypothetical protein n=1 Tax=Clostridium sp. C2-6-12 TaxID=2698832 RepID=UPI00136D1D66|nr:hypothetical protein [Clostridium sp. C2-6-12]
MHLILTSRDFLNDNSKNCIISNLKMPVEKCKILFVPNEKATCETIQSEKYYNRVKIQGFQRQNIFIFDYYHPENYVNLDIDAIYIS